MRIALAATGLAALAGAAVCACASHTTPTDALTLLGQDGTDANEVETQASSLTAALTLPSTTAAPATTSLTADELVATSDSASAYFSGIGGASCIQVAKNAATSTVTYTFRDCVGIWGLSRVSGTVTIAYTTVGAPGATGVHMVVHGDITLRRGAATYDASATLQANGLSRTMTWNGASTGTTARGRAFERTATWNIGWTLGGQSCVKLSGAAKGSVGDRTVDTTVVGYERCKGECPQAGGMIRVDESTGASLEIDYRGGATATFVIDQQPRDVVLACGL